MVEKVLVDTNVLIYAVRNKTDIQQALKKKFGIVGIYVPNVVLQELKEISEDKTVKGSDRNSAALAIKIIKAKKIPQPKLSGFADSAIVDWAIKNKGSVLTNDVGLKIKLKSLKVKVYCLRQKKLIKEW